MGSKNVIHLSVVLVLMLFSATSYSHNKVVVIPMAGDEPEPEPKIAFVSATTSQGNFAYTSGGTDYEGLEGADKICQDEAESTGAHPSLDGKTFKAWLYDTNTVINPEDTLTNGSRSFYIPDALISPSGRSLPAPITSGLRYILDPSIGNCDTATNISHCLLSLDSTYFFELASSVKLFSTSSPAYYQLLTFELFTLYLRLPQRPRTSYPGDNFCANFMSSDSNAPQPTVNVFDYIYDPFSPSFVANDTKIGLTSCNSGGVRHICVEQ